EDAVAVAVVLGERPSLLPGRDAARDGQLPRVQPYAAAELLAVPADPRVADGHLDALVADRELPREVGRHARDLALAEARIGRVEVAGRHARRSGRKAEEAVVLLEDAGAGHEIAVLVVGLGEVEVGIVRRVDPRIGV